MAACVAQTGPNPAEQVKVEHCQANNNNGQCIRKQESEIVAIAGAVLISSGAAGISFRHYYNRLVCAFKPLMSDYSTCYWHLPSARDYPTLANVCARRLGKLIALSRVGDILGALAQTNTRNLRCEVKLVNLVLMICIDFWLVGPK